MQGTFIIQKMKFQGERIEKTVGEKYSGNKPRKFPRKEGHGSPD